MEGSIILSRVAENLLNVVLSCCALLLKVPFCYMVDYCHLQQDFSFYHISICFSDDAKMPLPGLTPSGPVLREEVTAVTMLLIYLKRRCKKLVDDIKLADGTKAIDVKGGRFVGPIKIHSLPLDKHFFPEFSGTVLSTFRSLQLVRVVL